MESVFLDIFKVSPILGLLAIMWFYQRKDYMKLVEDIREDKEKRDVELISIIKKNQEIIDKSQKIIHKNQEIISELADKFDVVEDIKRDVIEIKNKLDK